MILVQSGQAGQRLDNFLLRELRKLPKSKVYRIIRKGEVRVNKKRSKPDYRINAGDSIRIPPLQLEPEAAEVIIPAQLARTLELRLLFENASLLIIDKPSGLAVHSGSGLRYGVIDVMRYLRPQEPLELVHRLDRDTSGCLMIARDRPALLELQRLMQQNALRKKYRVVVKGHWQKTLKHVDVPLLRQVMPNGERRVYVDARGQAAETLVDVLGHFNHQGIDFSLIEVTLVTGRTHQVRVHCQSQGHEIAGDEKYGDRAFNRAMRKLGCKRLLLHAHRLEIPASAHTPATVVEAPIPAIFTELVTG